MMHQLSRSSPIVLVLVVVVLAVCPGCGESRPLAAEATPAQKPVTSTETSKSAELVRVESTGERSAAPLAEPPARPSGLPSRGTKEVTFDDIKLELKKDDPFRPEVLTDKVKQLDGQSIKIRGYILPSFQQEGIKQFVLVRDNMECCFGPGALLHDCILVEMIAPATASFTVRPVSVEGKFSIQPVKDPVNGRHLAIYHLDGKQVR